MEKRYESINFKTDMFHDSVYEGHLRQLKQYLMTGKSEEEITKVLTNALAVDGAIKRFDYSRMHLLNTYDNDGHNIVMLAILCGYEQLACNLFEYVSDFGFTYNNKDKNGFDIYDLAEQKGMKQLMSAYKDASIETIDTFLNEKFVKSETAFNILRHFPELIERTNHKGQNIGMIAAEEYFENGWWINSKDNLKKIVKQTIANQVAATQKDIAGLSITDYVKNYRVPLNDEQTR